MLTPKDLRNHEFQAAGRNGYLATDVDDFMDEVFTSYDQMFRENAEIVRKLQVLADRLAKYKDDEENIRNALVEAQRMKNSIIVEAQQKAQGQLSETEEKIRAARESVDAQSGEILDKARVEADDILKDARTEAEAIIERANKKATDLLDTANAIYEEKVGSVAEEAAKEEAYLERVKLESARVRKQLSDTYQMQMELLSFAPDFSAALEQHEAEAEADEAPEEATFTSGEEVLGERAYRETKERLEEPKAKEPAAPVIPEVPEELPEEAPEEEAAVVEEPAEEEPAVEEPVIAEEEDDDGFGDIDKYLAGNSYEDLNDGNKYFK
ncbi:MAG: DivIVA domain-containing protein [Clostridia bacterium]|nr:DivIVA domain-containing protein [Clostridia bacterium]